jgi:hypothetical protein
MIAIGTRFWDNREGSNPEKIIDFVKRSLKLVDLVLVAINTKEDKSNAKEALEKKFKGISNLKVLDISYWGFSFALNALFFEARKACQKYLLMKSVEINISSKNIELLKEQINENTLCVGPALPGHNFQKNHDIKGTGITIPWNTCCLWNLSKIKIGVPLIADGYFDETYAGVEEVVTTSLIQTMEGNESNQIKLLDIPGIEWKTEFSGDDSRRLKHEVKMAKKEIRPEVQRLLLGLKEPKVDHL